MDHALSRRALDVFEEALDQPERTRAAWIATACGDNAALRAETMRLVEAEAGETARALAEGLDVLRGLTPMPERVGAYRLVSLLGAGGMGATYAATRADGLFDHEVAVKILRPSLLPETSRALFEKERRALAKLAHRHIAQLFDGGVTEAGAPYFIMERVRGRGIDAWASDKSAREIVAVLLDVCSAVAFAHQNLIVHADIKPSNVLMHESGEAKVIDFGVARILCDEPAHQTFPFTPEFASPARRLGAAPAPADDVYALGAMARVLLAGKHAEARSDLDGIVDRAASDDASLRHASVELLQNDLRSWLEFRPIAARANDKAYVAKKFVRRRRLRVAAAMLALLGLVTGLGVTSHLYAQAEAQRRVAEARFGEVRSLAHYMLFDLYDRLERTPRSLVLRRDVARVAQGYLGQLAGSAGAPDGVRRETIEGLLRVAEIQAGRNHANLGEYASAKLNLAEAERLAASLPRSAGIEALRTRIALRRASIAMGVDQDLKAAQTFIDVALRHRQHAGLDRLLALDLVVETVTLRNWQGRHQEARTLARSNLSSTEPEDGAQGREEAFLRSGLQDGLAEAEYYLGDLVAAEAAYSRYAAMTNAYVAANPDDMEALRNAIRARWALGTTLLARGNGPASLAQLEDASSRLPRLVNFEPDDEASQRLNRIVVAARAQALALTGRFDVAAALLRAQVAERRTLYQAAPGEAARARDLAVSLAMLADLYADHARTGVACPLYADAEGLLRALERRGLLTPEDRANALAMIVQRRAPLCS